MTIDTVRISEGAGSLSVAKEDKTALFPFNKDYAIIGNDTLALKGRTLYSKMSHTVYIPETAKKIFYSAKRK